MKTKFIRRTIKKLGLKFPVEIRLSYKPNAINCGEYQPKFNKWGDIKSHVIWIYMLNVDRGIKTTIVHELIHAWQEENNITEIHGKSFAKMAKCFKQYPDIYLKKVDTP